MWRLGRSRQRRTGRRRLPAYVGDAHPQVLATAGGVSASVDAALAPYLALAWSHGIETLNSCQGTADATGEYPFPDVQVPGYVQLKDGRQMSDLLVLWGWVGNTHEIRISVDREVDGGHRSAAVYFPSVAAMEHPPDYQELGADGAWITIRRGKVVPF